MRTLLIPPVLALPLLLAAGCAASGPNAEIASLAITAPEDGAFVGHAEVEVRGTTEVAGATEVRLNGRYIAVIDGEFAATLEFGDGPARINAELEGQEASVTVTVDTAPPEVIIESPAPGSFVDDDTLRVRGRVEDDNAESISLNGEEIALADDGTFDHIWEVAPGAHRLRFEASDRAGHRGRAWSSVLHGEFAGTSAAHRDALVIELGAEALGTLADSVESHLSSDNLEPPLLAANPLVSGFWGHLDIAGELHRPANLAFTPRSDYLEVALALPDVSVPMRADLRIGPDVTGEVTVDRALVRGEVRFGTAHGLPLVTVSDVEVTLEGLLIDIDGLWGWADEHVVTRAVHARLEAKIRTMIEEQIPLRLEDALAPLSGLREVDLADGRATLESRLEELSTSRLGLRATVDAGLHTTAAVSDFAERSPGSFVVGGAMPVNDVSGGGTGVFAAISTDLVNDAAHTAWLTGALSRHFDRVPMRGNDLTVGALRLLLPGIGADLPADSIVQFDVETALPPIVGPDREGLIALDLVDLRISAFAEVAGDLVPLFEVSAAVHAGVDVDLAGDEVRLSVTDFGIVADFIDGPSVATVVPLGPAFDELLTTMLEPKVEELAGIDGLMIPSLGGFSLTAPAASHRGGYLEFAADLTFSR